jgi:hypothetical protein
LNIVFDLGGVVVTWEPEVVIAKVFTDPVVQAKVRTQIIEAAKYLMLLVLPAVASPRGPFKKCRELHRGPSDCGDRVARAVAPCCVVSRSPMLRNHKRCGLPPFKLQLL